LFDSHHVRRTVARAPICAKRIPPLTFKRTIVKIGLPGYGHPRGQCPGVEMYADAERTSLIARGFLEDDSANLDTGEEGTTDAGFQRRTIQCLRLFKIRELREPERQWFGSGPICRERAVCPSLHSGVLNFGKSLSNHVRICGFGQLRHVPAATCRIPQLQKDPHAKLSLLRSIAGERSDG